VDWNRFLTQLWKEHWKTLAKVATSALFGGGTAGINGWWLNIIPIVNELLSRGILFSVLLSVAGICVVMSLHRSQISTGSAEHNTTKSRLPWPLLVWILLFCLSVFIYFFSNWLSARPALGDFGRDIFYKWAVPITYGLCFAIMISFLAEVLFFVSGITQHLNKRHT